MQTRGPFTTKDERGSIIVLRGEDKLSVTPSELSALAKLISMALDYTTGKALPPQVQWGQFQIKFSEEGNHRLERTGTDEGIVVTEADGDELIQLLGSSLNAYIDSVRLTGGPRRGVSTVSSPDPIVIGR